MRQSASAIFALIAQYAELNPDAVALTEPNGGTLSYREFWLRIEACRSRLEEAGIAPGEIVAVLVPPGVLQIQTVTGVVNHCVCAPLQPRTTVSEVTSLLRRLNAGALIASSEFDAETRAAETMGLTVLVPRHEQFPSQWEIRRAKPQATRQNRHADARLILATSATTSAPKLVPLTETNLEAGIAARRNSLKLAASDRLLLMTSLSHITGFENTLAQFQSGGAVIATPGFDPTAYLGWLSGLKPTWYACAPTVHQAALAQLMRDPPDAHTTLRFLQSAGAPLPDKARKGLEQILEVPVFNDYGMSEACPIALDTFLPGRRVPGSAGRSCGLEIRTLDSSGEFLPPGEDGEIVVRGPSVFSGYADDPEATRAAFQDGWFKTGDAGHLDGNGNLFVTGRLKEIINRGGEKIAPNEVDAVLASHPAVLEAAAFAVPHPTLGEDVAGAVVLRQGTKALLGPLQLRRYAAEHLAAFKVPHRIYFVEQIPRGELGKPQRLLLAERFGKMRSPPPTPAEVTEQITVHPIAANLHEMWARILDRDDLGFDEDFFDAGGDSLAAINMLAQVDERFGSQTSAQAASFLDEPTLAHLASLVDHRSLSTTEESSEIQIFPLRAEGTSSQLFCVPDNGAEGLYYRRLAKHLSGKIDLSVVRPANTVHSETLFSFERAGQRVAEAIRKAQPDGPYFVGGYCFGGVIAFEAARQLSLEGRDVRAILFDVPMPASSGLSLDWRAWLAGAKRQWHRLWTSKHPGITRNLRRFSSRLAWSALVPFRRFVTPIENAAVARRIVDWSEIDGFPLYKATPVDVPLLHILSTDLPGKDQPRQFDPASRLRWRPLARRGIEERFIPLDHYNVFYESNLPVIAETISRWCDASNKAVGFAEASSKKNDFS
jgi:oxalate---CoA ligase